MTVERFTNVITEETELREIFGETSESAVNNQIDRLDVHCRAIVENAHSYCLVHRMLKVDVMFLQREITLVLCGYWMIGRSPSPIYPATIA